MRREKKIIEFEGIFIFLLKKFFCKDVAEEKPNMLVYYSIWLFTFIFKNYCISSPISQAVFSVFDTINTVAGCMVVLILFIGSIDIHISSWICLFLLCVCFFFNLLGFVFREPFSDVFCEVRFGL